MTPVNRFAGESDSSSVLSSLSAQQKQALLDELLKEPTGREIDLNKPVLVHTPYREYPKMVYHHDTGNVLEVRDPAQEKAAIARGYQAKPSPGHDYSQLKGSVAAPKTSLERPEEELTADELAALDQADAGDSPQDEPEPAAEQDNDTAASEQTEASGEESQDAPRGGRRRGSR